MAVTLTDEALRILGLFEEVTEASGRDCLVEDDRVVVLVAAGDMGTAIGPGGQHVAEFEERLGRDVKLVEDADTAADFVANALAPAAVYHVTISENGDTVAYAEVDEADTGVAIGADGRNIDTARELAKRHFDVDDIQLA
ncbi:NusA-like transcription termination signal-binding factor [Haloarchaeobius sp. FL176]|uniref:NusA-like transcription termination signal-binding factor n=1 Tax=Haloarchaeobius sp. FL176 TaxID=2967129 RepID=UPI0021471F36|nr:NusA-like transcription termination signal-binding factor [Haloarchaeobius sp. FL176]